MSLDSCLGTASPRMRLRKPRGGSITIRSGGINRPKGELKPPKIPIAAKYPGTSDDAKEEAIGGSALDPVDSELQKLFSWSIKPGASKTLF